MGLLGTSHHRPGHGCTFTWIYPLCRGRKANCVLPSAMVAELDRRHYSIGLSTSFPGAASPVPAPLLQRWCVVDMIRVSKDATNVTRTETHSSSEGIMPSAHFRLLLWRQMRPPKVRIHLTDSAASPDAPTRPADFGSRLLHATGRGWERKRLYLVLRRVLNLVLALGGYHFRHHRTLGHCV